MTTTEVSLDDIAERITSIPDLLTEQLTAEHPDMARFAGIERWDVVGVGASDGPARLLAAVLSDLGFCACAHPISRFFGSLPNAHEQGARKRGLVVFSQGLSPNAQLALEAAAGYAETLVFTAVDAEQRPQRAELLTRSSSHLEVWHHGPRKEPGSLVRFAGPMVASLAALRFVDALSTARGTSTEWSNAIKEAPGAYRAALSAGAPWGNDPCACVAIGSDLTIASALMWKWQEALYARLAPALDVLSFAHGPLQSFFERPGLFLTLEREAPAQRELWTRFREVLDPSRHRVVPLRATLPGPLAVFEFDALLCSHLLAEMRARQIDPSSWPGQWKDGALYSLSPGRQKS